MALLSKDAIFAVDDRKYDTVSVPEWGGEVRLRSLSGTERDGFEATLQETRGGKTKQNVENFRARLIALCAVDEGGAILFTNRHEVVMLGTKSAAALQRLYDKCAEMNGFTEQDVEDLTEGFGEEATAQSTSESL